MFQLRIGNDPAQPAESSRYSPKAHREMQCLVGIRREESSNWQIASKKDLLDNKTVFVIKRSAPQS